MGYDIISAKTKKELDQDKELSHINCQYAYQEVFKMAFGYDISTWNGKLTIQKRAEFLKGIENLIALLDTDLGVPMYPGNISNRSQAELKQDFEELRDLIINGKIGYIKVT